MHYKSPKNKSQILLYPQIENWVSENNPVRLYDLFIEKIVLSNPEKFIWKGQSKTGCKSYSPTTMLKLLLYGYINNLLGSRRLERESYRTLHAAARSQKEAMCDHFFNFCITAHALRDWLKKAPTYDTKTDIHKKCNTFFSKFENKFCCSESVLVRFLYKYLHNKIP